MRRLRALAHEARQRWRRMVSTRAPALRDAASFWAALARDPDEVRRAVRARYPGVLPAYADEYVAALAQEQPGNPRVLLYLEAELGAAQRQRALVAEIEALRGPLRGRRCLDVGCSNGALARAAAEAGAAAVVGIDPSDARLAAARRLCAGHRVDLRLLEFGSDPVPDDLGTFDAVFCTDVLEHARSADGVFAAFRRVLAPAPGAFVFVSVFNGLHPACVASEPHYGIPGLVLLDAADARAVWEAVRGQVGSALDYEVTAWPSFSELKALAAKHGLRLTPVTDRGAASGRRLFWRGASRRMRDCREDVNAALARLDLPPGRRAQIEDAVARYAHTFLARHDEFAANRARLDDDAVLGFYMTYYAQPIRFVLTVD